MQKNEDAPFIPITEILRQIGDGQELPIFTPQRSGRRLRSRPVPMPRMDDDQD